MSYIHGQNRLLMCQVSNHNGPACATASSPPQLACSAQTPTQVLPGKAYRCTKLIHGASLKAGYDSHTSPDDKELVIFNSAAILPAYIVYFKQSNADFKYTKVTNHTATTHTHTQRTCLVMTDPPLPNQTKSSQQ